MRLFSTLFFILILNFAFGQVCVPDTSQIKPNTFIYPLPYQDTVPGSGIPNKACINTYYEQVFHVKVPYEVEFLGFNVHVKNIKLKSIDGLPSGLSYACEPAGCSMDANTKGCMKIFGTPDASNQAKIYPIKLNFTFSTVELPPLDLSFPDASIAPGKYEIELLPTGSGECIAAIPTIPGLIHRLYYDAATESLVLTMESKGNVDANMILYNASGNLVLRNDMKIENGNNQINVPVSSLLNGVYFYQIKSDNKFVVGKVIIY